MVLSSMSGFALKLTKRLPSKTSESFDSALSAENSDECAGDEHSETRLVIFLRPFVRPLSFGAKCGQSISCDSRSGYSISSFANMTRVLGRVGANPLSV